MRLKRHHYGILTATVLLLGILAGYSLFRNSIIPIARVNGDLIFLNEVQENGALSQRLYQQAPQLVEEDEQLALLLATGDQSALFTRAFQSSIVNAIIRTNVTADLEKRVVKEARVALGQMDEALFNDLLQSQYGWNVERFSERIIEPQLIQEILSEKYGEEYATWLDRAKKDATVRIWFVPFDWEDGELVKR